MEFYKLLQWTKIKLYIKEIKKMKLNFSYQFAKNFFNENELNLMWNWQMKY